MPQNRKKLVRLIIGNLSNALVHEILRKSSKNEEIAQYYGKEIENAIVLSKKYRKEINPPGKLSEKDIDFIRSKVISRAKGELTARISKGYRDIDLALIGPAIDTMLKEISEISEA